MDGPEDELKRTGGVVVDGMAKVFTREAYLRTIGRSGDGKPATVVSLFDQGEWWLNRGKRWLRIADMGPGHRYNTAAMLLRGAPVHAFRYAWGFSGMVANHDGGEMAHDALEQAADELFRETAGQPHAWLRATSLYKALTAGLTVQPDGTKPWQANGRDPVTGEPCEVPPRLEPVCMDSSCGCSGKAHP